MGLANIDRELVRSSDTMDHRSILFNRNQAPTAPSSGGLNSNMNPYSRSPRPAPDHGGRRLSLRFTPLNDIVIRDEYIYGNLCAVSPEDFPPAADKSDLYLLIQTPATPETFVVMARPLPGFPAGHIYLSDFIRVWCGVALKDSIMAEKYDPFSARNQAYIGSLELGVSFASTRKTSEATYLASDLETLFRKMFSKQILTRGQRLVIRVGTIPISFVVKKAQAVELKADAEHEVRGILVPETIIKMSKDGNSSISLQSSTSQDIVNPIFDPDFNLESLGIGGLDKEFTILFRRAFASRVFPSELVNQLGIQHTRGVLLYGPPGTGKTMIARQISKLLNAREPIIKSGPELLNKFVGASEENVRKMFEAAEKEYKEKGDQSALHVIILDELDAVCKKRGSGSGDTGVGDNIVNQLLTKLDGVNQLNNFLLIGMTNRLDMIDDALLRPGRLELHLEIGLPDEAGRHEILLIHTAKMRQHNRLGSDVDLVDLAAKTKNFSGAEIAGLVRAAGSFAMSRHTKVGNLAQLTSNADEVAPSWEDFMLALHEIKPLFGTSTETLVVAVPHGIIAFGPHIDHIMQTGLNIADKLKNSNQLHISTILLHGPTGTGKTALAAHIAMQAGFPFTQMIKAKELNALSDDVSRKNLVIKMFSDAHRSQLSILIVDEIEALIDYSAIGPTFSKSVLRTLDLYKKEMPPKGNRLLIIYTTSRLSMLYQLDCLNTFDYMIEVPPIDSPAALTEVFRLHNINISQEDMSRLKQHGAMPKLGIPIRSLMPIVIDAIELKHSSGVIMDRVAKLVKSPVPSEMV